MDARFPAIALLRKELLNTLRMKRIFALLALAVFCVFSVIAYQFNEASASFKYYGGMGRFAEGAMLFLAFGNLAIVGVLIPALAAVSVCVEKQQGNYDFLITTLISPIGILLAKMFNILCVYFLFLLATLPAFGALYYFVGIEWAQLLEAMFVLTVTAIHLCIAGMYCSIRFYRTTVAVMASYGLALLISGLPQGYFSMFLYERLNMFQQYDLEDILTIISAPVNLVAVFDSNPIRGVGGDYKIPYFLFYNLFFILLFALLSIRALRKPMPDLKVETRKPIDDQSVLEHRRKRFPYYLADPLRRRDLLPDGRNPIVYKEIYSSLLGNSTRRIRAAYLTAIVAFVVSIVMISGYGTSEEVPKLGSGSV